MEIGDLPWCSANNDDDIQDSTNSAAVIWTPPVVLPAIRLMQGAYRQSLRPAMIGLVESDTCVLPNTQWTCAIGY